MAARKNDTWSSFVKNPNWLDEDCEAIAVRCIPFQSVLSKYRVPYYLKIDIEGADVLCLQELKSQDLPAYLSFEAGPQALYAICHLASLGFNAFKLVDQTKHNVREGDYSNEKSMLRWKYQFALWKWTMTRKFHLDLWPVAKVRSRFKELRNVRESNPELETNAWLFGEHSSGPFDEESKGRWLTFEEVAYNWLHRRVGFTNRGTLNNESCTIVMRLAEQIS